MKKITITNAYTWYNKGDAGILLGIVELLKKKFGENNVEINILSFTPDVDKKNYCLDNCIKNVYSNILNPHPYKHTKIGKKIAIIKLFFRMIYIYIATKFFMKKIIKKEVSLKILEDSDLIIVCGGGFLGGKKYDSLMHIFQIYIDTLFNKPVIVMGTSIEPIKSKIIRKCTEKVLKNVDFVYARESITYEYLKTFLDENKFSLIPDMAFMLNEIKKTNEIIEKIRLKTNYIFGITVRDWNFPNSHIPVEQLKTNYKNVIARVMSKYIDEKNAYFIFIPQVIVDTGNDTIIAKEIKSMLEEKYRDNFIIIESDLSPIDIKSMIGNLDFFIGTRMHSNIFATSMRIPTVAIAYEKKTNGIMQTVGLTDYVIEINDITVNKLVSNIDKCIENSENIKKILDEKIPELKDTLMREFDKIINKYEEKLI